MEKKLHKQMAFKVTKSEKEMIEAVIDYEGFANFSITAITLFARRYEEIQKKKRDTEE